jgi:regulator of sigma E protease
LLFFAFEVARGRPLSERAQKIILRIGLATVIALVIFATGNDVMSISQSTSGSG